MVIQRVLPALALLGIMAGIALAGEETPPPPPVEAPPAAQQVEAIRQVQIQVWISETTEDGLRDIGTNLDYTRFVRGNENSGSVERISTRVFDPNSFQVTLPAADANPYADNVRLTPDFPASVAQGSTLQGDAITTQSGAGITFSIIDSGTGTIDGIAQEPCAGLAPDAPRAFARRSSPASPMSSSRSLSRLTTAAACGSSNVCRIPNGPRQGRGVIGSRSTTTATAMASSKLLPAAVNASVAVFG